jgi:protein farnesyltransferase subunit beta
MQGSEVELGGFKGRTNKLVDGCYSWWVGGAFALLEAVKGVRKPRSGADKGAALNDTTDWQDVDGTFWHAFTLFFLAER